MSKLEELLALYPSAPWDWALVSSNPAVSFRFIIDHPELPWVWKYVSQNASVTEQDIINNLECPWVYEGLCANPNLSLDFFNKYIIKPDVVIHVDWHLLSANPSITMIDVINNPKYRWDDRYLSMNPNLTSNFILNEGKDRKWVVPFVCSNPGITERDIFKSTLKSMFDWDYKNLSSNPNLPIKYVHDNIDKNWNFHSISANVSITDLHTFHKINWDSHGLSINPNITFDFIKQHSKINWHKPSVLANGSISLETIINNYEWFDGNRNETYISSNPTITLQWVQKNQHCIDWKRLSANRLS